MLRRSHAWSRLLTLTLLITSFTAACTGGEGARQDLDAAAPVTYVIEEIDPEAYAAEILASRAERDEQYASLEFSPLAVVAIAHLDRERTTIGSDESADLPLLSSDVAPLHAEILRSEAADGSAGILLRAVDGVLWTVGEPALRLGEMDFDRGARARIGQYTVYSDSLGTFGAVVRALDFNSPAYTEFTGLEYFHPTRRTSSPPPSRPMKKWRRSA